MNKVNRKSILVGSLSFFIVLFTMPLGHALMILMEHFLTHQQLYYSAFAMGAVGLVLTIVDPVRYVRSIALLDRLDRVRICLLRSSSRRTAATQCCRRSDYQARISYATFVRRILGDVYVPVSV